MQIYSQSEELPSYSQEGGEKSGDQNPSEEKSYFQHYDKSFEDNYKRSDEFKEEQNLCKNAATLYDELKSIDKSLQFKDIQLQLTDNKRDFQEILQALENKLATLSDFNKKKEELKKSFEVGRQKKLLEDEDKKQRNLTKGSSQILTSFTQKMTFRAKHSIKNDLRDIIWEPQTLFEKLLNLFQGCIESIYMLIVGLICLYTPSFVSFACYLACIQHHFFMLYNIKVRFLKGLKVQALVFTVLTMFIITKLVYLKNLCQDAEQSFNKSLKIQVKRTSQTLFIDDLQFYKSFGFSLSYDDKKCSVNFDQCYYEVDIFQSFTFERFMMQLNLLFCTYLWLVNLKIQNLFQMKAYKLNHLKKLEAHFNKKNDEEESDLELSEDSQGEEIDNNLQSSKSMSVTFGYEERQKDKQKELKYLRLKKEVSKNFIESKYFFSWKHTFYVMGISSQLIGSLIRKNILELPFIFLILICIAFYFVRRKYQKLYWTYQLYLIKLIQRTNILKQLSYIILCLEYVQSYLSSEHNTVKSTIQIIYGQDKFVSFQKVFNSEGSFFTIIGCLLITVDLFFMHGFYLCLSLEVRDKFGVDLPIFQQVKHQIDCITKRTEDDAKLNEEFNDFHSSVQLAPEKDKQEFKTTVIKEEFYDNQERKMKRLSKKENTFETEIYITLLSRILMFILGYMYHSAAGFLCVIWVLISFILPSKIYKLVSIFVTLPILCIQFIFIYGIRTQVLRETWFFQTFAAYYDWEMKNEWLELIFMSLVILLYMIMVTLHFDKLIEPQIKGQLLDFFSKKVQNKNSSKFWKVTFLTSKYLYMVVLAWLFFQSFMQNFANLLAMEYLFFFLLYTSSSWLYRNTSFLIIWFISINILGQYYCSLIWPCFKDKPTLVNTFYWLDFFPQKNNPYIQSDSPNQYENIDSGSRLTEKNPFNIKKSQDIYFRLEANYLNWLTLLLIVLCRYLNTMQEDKTSRNKVQELTEETQNQFQEKNPKISKFINNFEKYFLTLINHLLTYTLIIWQVLFLETNFITWMYFILNIISLAFQLRNNKTQQSHKNVQKAFGYIKVYSAIIIVLHIAFVLLLGDLPKTEDYHSSKLNYKFMKTYPKYYQYLNIIGFRSIVYSDVHYDFPDKEKRDFAMRVTTIKLSYYVGAFLIATYCENFYFTQSKETEAEENFNDKDYKKLFEYSITTDQKEKFQKQNEEKVDIEESVQSGERQYTKVFTKSRFYSMNDFQKFYEKQTFSTSYYVYTLVDYWNYFDAIAQYGHIINNFIVFYLALFRSLSFYFFLNLFFILMFYSISSQRIKYDSNNIRRSSGLQSQCDLNMAKIITKKYKTQAFYEFLYLRKKIWVLQCFTFLVAISVGYPSSLLKNYYKLKEKQLSISTPNDEKENLRESISSTKTLIFNLIFFGVYKDESPDFKYNFYYDFIFVIVGLFIENQCINWLENRFGCNYFRFQKFIELDMRYQAFKNSWGNKNPQYNIENYRKHYFKEDFEELKIKFEHNTHADFIKSKTKQISQALTRQVTQNYENSISKNEKDKNQMKEKKPIKTQTTQKLDIYNLTHSFGDFLPQKKALMIKEMISFSLLIDCEAPEIVKDQQTKILLKEKDLDYESIPILRQFKIKSLRSFLQQNIETKYKISLAKGMKMVAENFIMMLMMISLVLKCNLFSLVYLLLVIRYSSIDSKTDFLIRMVFYQAICLLVNYFLILLNLNPKISPRPFPTPFQNFPDDWIDKEDKPIYFTPFFFNFPYIRHNLLNGVMFGLGIDKTQFYSLFIDLINVFIISAYVIHFKNPILARSMKKVFWEFPASYRDKKTKEEKQSDQKQTDDNEENDQKENWDRLDKEVKKQVLFLRYPSPYFDQLNPDKINEKFQDVKLTPGLNSDITTSQYNFIIECKQKGKTDKNKILKTYTDIISQNVWSEENIKAKKRELKMNSGVYRIVKKGSISIYLFFHVFTLFIILFMGVLRQSLLSLGYVIILIPHLSKASDVLKQRQGSLEKQLEKVKKEKKLIQIQYEQLFYASIANKFKMKFFGKFVPDKIIGSSNLQKVSYLLFSEKLDIGILEKEEIKRIISKEKNYKQISQDMQLLQAKENNLKQRLEKEQNDQYWNPQSNLFYLILIHAVNKFQENKEDKIEQDIWEKFEQKQKKVDEIKKEISANKQIEIKAGEFEKGKKTSGWSLIPVLQNLLLGYALLDLILSIIYQLPIIQDNQIFRIIGLKKIFTSENYTQQNEQDILFKKYLDPKIESLIYFDDMHFRMQTFSCLIVAIIFLQSNIFDSPGYIKFITQEDGSMDLFIKLSKLKAQLLTYISNNQKLNTVQQNQKWRQKILNVVDTIKKKVEKLRKIEKKNFELKEKPQEINKIEKKEEEEIKPEEKPSVQNEKNSSQKKRTKNATKKYNAKIDDDQDTFNDFGVPKEAKKLSDLEFQEKINKLAKAFVKDKMKKFGCCSSYYQWFNQSFCQPLILDDNENELEELKKSLAAGKIQLLTSLEKTFRSEATEFIYNYYSTSEKKRTFELELEKYKDLYSVYEISDIDQKLRVEEMPLMSEFFSGYSLYIRFFETFSLILISQSQNLIFISMILSMYVNAGLVSLFYPFAVFGYGLLEEKRPDKAFWKIVLKYSLILLFAKILINLEILQKYVFENEHYLLLKKDIPIEFLAASEGVSSFVFLLPEAMIVCFIMLNQIKLKMLGLDYQSENEIEIIHDAIIRVEAKGNQEKIAQMREQELNDNMQILFYSAQEQKQEKQNKIIQEKQNIIQRLKEMSDQQVQAKYEGKSREQIAEDKINKKFSFKNLELEHETLFFKICDEIHFTSRKFDLDSVGVHSFTDDLIEWNCIQKVLESDSLTYVEGFRKLNQSKFMSKEEFQDHKLKKENWEVMSADDFDVFEEDQLDYLNQRKEQKVLGWMDKKEYFKRLFPPVQIQKPGEDYLGSITFSLIFILYYLFANFDQFTFSQDSLEYMQDEISFFSQEFIIVSCFVIFVLLFERIVNRTNTIKKESNLLDVQGEGDHYTHKHHNHHHINNDNEKDDDQLDHNFPKKDFKTIEDQNSQYKVSYQQKWKYYLHFLMLILGHIYIFFIIPIKSNTKLYGAPICDQSKKGLYMCYNFHSNGHLRILYILLVLYLWFSAQQISKGFPMKRKASLLLEGYWWLPRLCTDIVTGIPFFTEIRCLIDYMSSNTSLDYSQFVQLFVYHKRFYACAVGNRSYHFRKLGAKQNFCDRFLCGHLVSLLFIILIIGPLILFSQFSPLLGNNPVEVINVNVHYDVQSLLFSNEDNLKQVTSENYTSIQELNKIDQDKYKLIQHQMRYKIYENQNAYQRNYVNDSDRFINKSNPEILNFQDNSVQIIELRQYSDKEWESSFENREQLQNDMLRIYKDAQNSDIMNFSLTLDFEFQRKQPETARVASIQQKKVLNVTNYFDCMTAKELKEVSKIDCTDDDKQRKSVVFSQVYIPGISLGQTANGKELNTKGERIEDQKFDVKLTQSCNGEQPYWSIEGNKTVNNLVKTLNLNKNSDNQIQPVVDQVLLVKNTTSCELMDKTRRCELQKIRNHTYNFSDVECFPNGKDEQQVNNPNYLWTRIKLAVFSLQVTTSFLAAYTVLTFYVLILFSISGILRMIFVTDYWLAKFVESTHVMPLIKICEACYIYRHEEDLVKEEETYRVLQEAIRSDALFKALSGSSLMGENDPQYDDLDKDQKKKLLQLEKLEQKGFEVSNLKKKIVSNKNQAQDEFEDLTQDRELKQ